MAEKVRKVRMKPKREQKERRRMMDKTDKELERTHDKGVKPNNIMKGGTDTWDRDGERWPITIKQRKQNRRDLERDIKVTNSSNRGQIL